ncbi:MAG: hypothetical protein GX857_09025 [Bacteroidales bacterium]|nr:hypothetical protein [Bacteroidales bacterium]
MSIIKNGNLGINRVSYSRMLKAEVAEFANKTIGIAQKYQTEEFLIGPVLDQLLATKPEIEVLGVKYGIDPMRQEIDNLKSQMMLTVSTLKLKVKLMSKSKNDAELRLVSSFIDTYLRYFDKSKNDKDLNQKVAGFMNAIDTEERLAEALSKHSLIPEVNNIKLANVDLEMAWSRRVSLLANRPKVETRIVMNTVNTAVDNLFKAIEVGHLMNPEQDFTALADELNQLSIMFNRSISIRQANNQRKNSKDKDGDSTEEGTSSEPLATAMHLDNGWGADEGYFSPFNPMDNPADETDAEELRNDADANAEDEDGAVALE